MSRANATYEPADRGNGFRATLTVEDSRVVVSGTLRGVDRDVEGDTPFAANGALINSLWAYGKHECWARRRRDDKLVASHRRAANSARKVAEAIARLAARPGSILREGWCSACFGQTTHRKVDVASVIPVYLCEDCGSPTTPCAAPGCSNLANRSVRNIPQYCAEHRHDIPSFETLDSQLSTIDEYRSWLEFSSHNFARTTRVSLIVIGATAVAAPMAIAAAPVIGGATGALTGLHGAAATSHGLAIWGGGALAAGGLGMSGGTMVLTALGSALGGTLGGIATSAYVKSDRSFDVARVKDGTGTPVLVASGFLSENNDWEQWRKIITERYPDNPVYYVRWGAKELRALGAFLGLAGSRAALAHATRALARRASQSASVPGAAPAGVAFEIAKNPWSVARFTAERTGVALADLIARTSEAPFILVGHSLGARVMVNAAQALASKSERSYISEIHLLGAAISTGGDWYSLGESTSGSVHNYFSSRDQVLGLLYRTAQLGRRAVGQRGFKSNIRNIEDHDVTPRVKGHSDYLTHMSLR